MKVHAALLIALTASGLALAQDGPPPTVPGGFIGKFQGRVHTADTAVERLATDPRREKLLHLPTGVAC